MIGRRAFAAAVGGLLVAGCATSPKPTVVPPAVQVPAEPPPRRKPRLGLALGGGAARGFAHIGVILALEEAGIRPDLIVGTSAGSVVGALYASGKTGIQLQRIGAELDEASLTDWTLPWIGGAMLRGEALARFINTEVGGRLLEDMVIPLGVVATNLNTGQGILFQRGDTGQAVRASSAVPSVFQPVRIAGQTYVDGGLVSPVPVRYARQMGADVVLAVDISSAPEGNATGDALQVLLQTFAIMGQSINSFELKNADVLVRPALVGFKSADFAGRARAVQAGRSAMQAVLPQLRQRLVP